MLHGLCDDREATLTLTAAAPAAHAVRCAKTRYMLMRADHVETPAAPTKSKSTRNRQRVVVAAAGADHMHSHAAPRLVDVAATATSTAAGAGRGGVVSELHVHGHTRMGSVVRMLEY